ncbi:hypothetical protein BJ138DRAFT_1120858, partial [Hygrophoropsis aurantiaca]
MYWKRIAALFGWQTTATEHTVNVNAYDFQQNGTDCGPIAASVAMYLLRNGPDAYLGTITKARPTPTECAHFVRKSLLDCVSNSLFTCHRWWESMKHTEAWLEKPAQEVVEVIRNGGLEMSTEVTVLRVLLARAQDRCCFCKESSKADLQRAAGHDNGSGCSDGPEVVPGGGFGSEGESSSDPNAFKATLPLRLKKLKAAQKARNRVLGASRAPRFKPEAVALPAERFHPLPVDDAFDDYLDGPTLEDLEHAIRENAQEKQRSTWENFRDYGYRTLPDFAVSFNKQHPTHVSEHVLPVGAPEFLDPKPWDEDVAHHQPLDRSGAPLDVSVEDGKVLGMAEMLEEAGPVNSPKSVDLFVHGLTVEKKYVCLRPERNAELLCTGEVRVTLDIDSLIWVTHEPRVLGSLKVNVLPYFGSKPPIAKNNHCQVEILLPQSEQDATLHGSRRSEWFTKSVPISSVPHIHFAQMGDGSGSVNFYVAFPRMMHKNPNNGRAATLVPAPVQMAWLTQVLLPAMKKASPQEIQEYANFTYEEWKWKATVNKQLKTSRTLTLDPTTILDMVRRMRDLVSGSPDQLDMFGSFFFIADTRGIKLNTITVRGRSPNPLHTLYQEIPTLDWEHMMRRENGQLLLDLGVSYHPDPVSGEPMVGMWKLNSVHASYAKAGMNKPEEFKTCTMPRHGGLQATMERTRSRAVQLTFRSTYNLIFEAFRRPGQEEKFCVDSEAYANTAVFQQT